MASDHLPADGLSGEDAIAMLADHRLSFDPGRQAGVVLHMLGAAPTLGLIGVTALAPTAAEAHALYDRTAELLSGAARRLTQAA